MQCPWCVDDDGDVMHSFVGCVGHVNDGIGKGLMDLHL